MTSLIAPGHRGERMPGELGARESSELVLERNPAWVAPAAATVADRWPLCVGEELVFRAEPRSTAALRSLTATEHRVLKALLRNLSNAAIARQRGVRERTVANQVHSIFRKLRVSSRSEIFAVLAGHLGSPNSSLEPENGD